MSAPQSVPLKAVYCLPKDADDLIAMGVAVENNKTDALQFQGQAIGGGLLGGVLQKLLLDLLQKFIDSGQLNDLLKKLLEQFLGTTPPAIP